MTTSDKVLTLIGAGLVIAAGAGVARALARISRP
jgi:hypothetical protein